MALNTLLGRLVDRRVANNNASMDFVDLMTSDYARYLLKIRKIKIGTNNTRLRLLLGNSTTFDNGSTDYQQTAFGYRDGSNVTAVYSPAASGVPEIFLDQIDPLGDLTNEFFNADITINYPTDMDYTFVEYRCFHLSQTPELNVTNGVGLRTAQASKQSIQIIPVAGVIESGQFELYGLH